MKLKAKQQIQGSTVILVDAGTANIDELVQAMTKAGWTFDILQASYTSKTGEKKRKDIPADKIVPIQKKFNLNNWSFKASKGSKVIVAQMTNKEHLIAIRKENGGALKEFLLLPVGEIPTPKPVPAQAPIQKQGQLAQQRAQAEDAAAELLYCDEGSHIPEITPLQKEARRAALRKEDKAKISKAAAKKHPLLIIFAILEIISLAGIVFGIYALKDAISARKKVTSDPGESERLLKEARMMLIFGVLAFVGAVTAWNLPALLH